VSVNRLLHQAAAGAGGDPVYVDDVFSTFVYEGTGANRTITNNIDLSGEGGLVWIKDRETGSHHIWTDTERGATKVLWSGSDGQYGERTESTYLTGFTSSGFTVGGGSEVNGSGKDTVAWTFRKQKGFFDIVTYIGTGNTTGGSPQWREISHNLGTAPGMIIVKKLGSSSSDTGNWFVWHRGLPDDSIYAAQSGFLNQSANFGGYSGFQTAANQTSAHFSLRQNSSGQTNDSGASYVAYLFAHDAQDFGTNSDEAIIKCGSYTGNGSSTGPTVDLGFEPQWLLFKKATGSAEEWIIHDNMRGLPVGGNDAELLPASGSQEYSSYAAIDVTATGFNITHTSARYNENSQTYIYMAIRRPHKPASEFAATQLFNVDLGANTDPGFDTGFPVDMGIFRIYGSTSDFDIMTRLTQPRRLDFTTGTEANKGAAAMMDYMDGWSYNVHSHIGWSWRRAPGYHDVVCYNGTGSARTVAHNLAVSPEMIWLKNRGSSANWEIYLNAGGTEYGYYGLDQKYVGLNTSLSTWNNTSPTNSVVSVSSQFSNSSHSYIMYLFASVPGISKIGTYSGTGSELTVDCGFSAGARYVLIKRADNSMGSGGESFFAFDTVRGITASSSPYLALNDSDAQVTGSFIKPDSSGFKVTSQSVVNTNGSTYVFYAIA